MTAKLKPFHKQQWTQLHLLDVIRNAGVEVLIGVLTSRFTWNPTQVLGYPPHMGVLNFIRHDQKMLEVSSYRSGSCIQSRGKGGCI